MCSKIAQCKIDESPEMSNRDQLASHGQHLRAIKKVRKRRYLFLPVGRTACCFNNRLTSIGAKIVATEPAIGQYSLVLFHLRMAVKETFIRRHNFKLYNVR